MLREAGHALRLWVGEALRATTATSAPGVLKQRSKDSNTLLHMLVIIRQPGGSP